MNLCIDIGNSIVKAAVLLEDSEVIEVYRWKEISAKKIELVELKHPQIENVIICSVRQENSGLTTELTTRLEENFRKVILFDETTEVPLVNLYKTAGTLGKDRLAAVTGANNIYPGRNVLVIDLGTAITYDLIDEFGHYHGGNISPGLTARFRALHEFTGRLPLITPKKSITGILADNTEDAIAMGVQNGILYEIESYILNLKDQFTDLLTVITGGDAGYFDKKLKNTIFVHPFITFIGLNRILQYNANKR